MAHCLQVRGCILYGPQAMWDPKSCTLCGLPRIPTTWAIWAHWCCKSPPILQPCKTSPAPQCCHQTVSEFTRPAPAVLPCLRNPDHCRRRNKNRSGGQVGTCRLHINHMGHQLDSPLLGYSSTCLIQSRISDRSGILDSSRITFLGLLDQDFFLLTDTVWLSTRSFGRRIKPSKFYPCHSLDYQFLNPSVKEQKLKPAGHA